MSKEYLYPDSEDRNNRLKELEESLKELLSQQNDLKVKIDELILEKDILNRIDVLEKFLNKEIKVDLKFENK